MILEWKDDYNKDWFHNTWTKFNANGNQVEKIKYFYGSVSNSKTETKRPITKVPQGVLESIATYPGCEHSKSNSEKKQFVNETVNKIIGDNFNTKLGYNTGLSGKQRIVVMFKVDKAGYVTDIQPKGPRPSLESEAIRVISLLPKFKPEKQKGKPVIMPFSIPIVFNVQ